MTKYFDDPVLNVTASGLRVIRWFALGLMGLGTFSSLVAVYTAMFSNSAILNKSAQESMLIFSPMAVIMFFLFARLLKYLREIVLSVGEGQPLTVVNAGRLRSMGWLSLGIQAVVLLAAAIMATLGHKGMLDVDLIYDLVACAIIVSILFILARVFEHGARIQDDLEGTV